MEVERGLPPPRGDESVELFFLVLCYLSVLRPHLHLPLKSIVCDLTDTGWHKRSDGGLKKPRKKRQKKIKDSEDEKKK